MKAIQVASFGDADQLRLSDIPEPGPEAAHAIVEVHYAGVNFIDVYMRDGTYAKSATYQTPLPMTLGMEGAGVIVQIDPGHEMKAGDTVAWCLARGSYAQLASVPVDKLVPVPADVPMSIATTLMLQGSTAHYLAHSAFTLREGHSCLIHAAAGGVGQLLVQRAKSVGATVIATVGSAAKAQTVNALGADHCILYRETDFASRVQELTHGEGVDVVYDSVGAATIDGSLQSLKRRGYCINYGASSGQAPPIAPLQLAEAGSLFLTRPHLADYIATVQERRSRSSDLFEAWRSGALKVSVDREYSLGEAVDAHRRLESRASSGKLLLRLRSGSRGGSAV